MITLQNLHTHFGLVRIHEPSTSTSFMSSCFNRCERENSGTDLVNIPTEYRDAGRWPADGFLRMTDVRRPNGMR